MEKKHQFLVIKYECLRFCIRCLDKKVKHGHSLQMVVETGDFTMVEGFNKHGFV